MNKQHTETTRINHNLLRELAYATAACAVTVTAGIIAELKTGFDDLSLILITAVIFVSVRTRMSVAVYSAILCFLAYNFFFINPRYTFFISASNGVATVTMFLVAALVCGRLANKLRTQVVLLSAANSHASFLQHFGQRLTSAADEDDAMRAAADALREVLDSDVVLIGKDDATGALRESGQPAGKMRYDPALQASAARCLSQGESVQSGFEAAEARDLSWHCLPVMYRDRIFGAACFRFSTAIPQIPPEKSQLVEAMLRDLAQTLARARLVHQLEEARFQGESERLRAALLSSVSHDLRSPLSTIIGSAESLSAYRNHLSEDDQLALVRDIHSEGLRLDRYIQNLLDMTKVGRGELSVTREWIGFDEICGSLAARLGKIHPNAMVRLLLPDPVPLLNVNPALIEQALFNIVDNAVKFSPADMPITLSAENLDGSLQIDVIDHGPGIPESERVKVFDRFYTSDRSDRRGSGTGLGLTICQGIVAAHGGSVLALPGINNAGLVIRIRLPLDAAPTDPPKDD